jgi:hypothetical protein
MLLLGMDTSSISAALELPLDRINSYVDQIR